MANLPVTAVMLAGGMGSRLYPYTAFIPKPLVPIDKDAIAEVLLRQLAHYGTQRVVVQTNTVHAGEGGAATKETPPKGKKTVLAKWGGQMSASLQRISSFIAGDAPLAKKRKTDEDP